MKRKDSGSVRVRSVFGAAALLLLLASAFDGAGRAVEGATAPVPPPPPEEEEWPVIIHPPNTLYTDGLEDEVAFETMPAAERAGVLLAKERTSYGEAVHAAWSSAVTRPRDADAKVKKAAAQSGTTGLDTVGVEP